MLTASGARKLRNNHSIHTLHGILNKIEIAARSDSYNIFTPRNLDKKIFMKLRNLGYIIRFSDNLTQISWYNE